MAAISEASADTSTASSCRGVTALCRPPDTAAHADAAAASRPEGGLSDAASDRHAASLACARRYTGTRQAGQGHGGRASAPALLLCGLTSIGGAAAAGRSPATRT